MEIITSRENRRLKFARSVREGKDKAHIFIEGVRLAVEALRSGLILVEILISDNFQLNVLDEQNLPQHFNQLVVIVDNKLFESIADTNSSQGIIIIAKRPAGDLHEIEERLNTSTIPLVLYLSEINNPSNVGAVFRTAEAAGVAGVIISTGAANAFSPKALRAAMGANMRLPVIENVEFEEALKWAAEKGITTTAADINGKIAYTDANWKLPRMLVFGSEAHGLSEENRAKMGQIINIPMESDVESLNIAVSAGIILFEAKRQIAQ